MHKKTLPPPLAAYRRISDYVPTYGDFIIWAGWLTSWNGVVSNYEEDSKKLHVVFSTLPFLLFTMSDAEIEKNTRIIDLDKIRTSPNGVFSVCQHDFKNNTTVWYI